MVSAQNWRCELKMAGFDNYYRNNPFINNQPSSAQDQLIYVPIAELIKVGAKVTWDENQRVYRVTSDYQQLLAQNQQLRQKITELKGLVRNQPQRANDQNWEMHLADQGNSKYSSATLPVDLTLLTLK